jgi:Arc/MetJ-type ribon-helix-helix transcriptional regulator
MGKSENGVNVDFGAVWHKVRAALAERGIDVDCADGEISVDCSASDEEGGGPRVKVVCVSPGVKDSVDEMSRTPRDQVLMVRVDEATSRDLDAWVETGAVKSRSEAAALFIREGLKVRQAELTQLREALDDVKQAKDRLRDRAREVFGAE